MDSGEDDEGRKREGVWEFSTINDNEKHNGRPYFTNKHVGYRRAMPPITS